MVLSFIELVDIVVMSAVVGYIFMDIFKTSHQTVGFDWQSFKMAVIVTAPALIIHELFHKFVALSYGFQASFNAAYTFLGLGVLLKLISSPFIFFVPAYVSIGCSNGPCTIAPLTSAIIAFAGPLANLILFTGSWYLLKKYNFDGKWKVILHLTKQINLLLFILNMLPIPLFDGFKVYSGIWQAFF